jgi:archaellum component FlaF (FlaF/FlaG flagellin family)
MGFSLIAATAILGITLFMAVEIIVSDLLPTMEEINTSYTTMKDRMQEQLHTEINITTVVRSANGTNYDYNISVENTGSITLPTDNFVILLDGIECPFYCSGQFLYPENIIYFIVKNQTGEGQNRLKIISNNGIASFYTYGG